MMTELRDFATDDARALAASELDTVTGGVTTITTEPVGNSGGSGSITVADAWNAFFRAARLPAPF